ncbi:hypothetical protein [Aldersonia kunmingensis]|uniref:hypothetical protein n=1 Tax=Aldersonia kunmingensis TaxID=408066 RepID=UPI00082BB4A7|nr:hypothetical protein [Aldersonia kunmingensis]
MTKPRDIPDIPTRQERADRLKERIYLTFTALAVVLALRAHGDDDAAKALATLVVTVFGTLLAVFTADIVSHLVVHERMMTRKEFRHAVSSSFGALGAVTLPVVFLVLAVLDVWKPEAALRASTIALIAALVVIAFAAVRHTTLNPLQRLIALGAEAALGVAVVGLQILAHG